MKLVHLDGFVTKKFVTMHGHMNGGGGGKTLSNWNSTVHTDLYFFACLALL